jgi:hypothetical protein
VYWSTSNISAQVSSVILLRSHLQASISASRRVSPRSGGCGGELAGARRDLMYDRSGVLTS